MASFNNGVLALQLLLPLRLASWLAGQPVDPMAASAAIFTYTSTSETITTTNSTRLLAQGRMLVIFLNP